MAAVYLSILTLIPIIFSFYFFQNWPQRVYNKITGKEVVSSSAQTLTPVFSPTPTPAPKYLFPVQEFTSRITKKDFGLYVSPQDSPVTNERFTGFHTGVDIEFDDTPDNVSVVAIASGTVVYSRWTSGYGGLVAISHPDPENPLISLYGHLDPDTIIANGTQVKAGQEIGIIGQGNTRDTDFERKHLHFAILKGSQLNTRGYVSRESELSSWINPLTLYRLE